MAVPVVWVGALRAYGNLWTCAQYLPWTLLYSLGNSPSGQSHLQRSHSRTDDLLQQTEGVQSRLVGNSSVPSELENSVHIVGTHCSSYHLRYLGKTGGGWRKTAYSQA